ncbi:hypothetical protein B0I35DRAFT_507908 [Stachybotrys elegans]|uniref:Uncharacterized protein n=1 Tax=Stachybotrys elegans TaxID=80388 RepID=A0A8K0T9B7_9HYPO|nr:hypothetical protein B0I35DRAFT_507908 [Stachybotrys elegans]
MRFTVILTALFVAVASAATVPRDAGAALDPRQCVCYCNESNCSGPACCASGNCPGGNSAYC